MRRLNTSDVFAAFRLVKEAGLKDEVKRMALLVEKEEKPDIKDIGVEFLLNVVEGLPSVGAEDKMYKFLSGPMERKPEEIKEMPVLELVEELEGFKDVEDIEGWKAFFKSVAAMMK